VLAVSGVALALLWKMNGDKKRPPDEKVSKPGTQKGSGKAAVRVAKGR